MFDATIERYVESPPYVPVTTASSDASGVLTYVDTDVSPGIYGYLLRVDAEGTEFIVELPRLQQSADSEA